MLHFLTIVLVILKALGYITFSWFICFLPSIIVVTFSLLIIIVAYFMVKD